jgi:geranylgeranyl diphosphate synthase type II
MIRLKTSVLLGFALELGGILGGADDESIRLLYEAGENMGIGFQLKDDLLDVYGDPSKFGKQVGGDIISNKKTFLLIEALSKADPGSRAELDKWIGQTSFDKSEKVEAITSIYEHLGIRSFTEQKIQEYFEKGLSSLHALKIDEKRKEPLLQFAQQLVEREK